MRPEGFLGPAVGRVETLWFGESWGGASCGGSLTAVAGHASLETWEPSRVMIVGRASGLASRVLDSVAMIGISTSPQPKELEIEHDAGVIGNKYQDATAPLALQVVLCQHRVRLLLSMADPNKRAALRSAPMADMPWGRVPKDLIVTRADGLQEHDSAMQVSSDTVVQTRGPMVARRMDDKNSNDKA